MAALPPPGRIGSASVRTEFLGIAPSGAYLHHAAQITAIHTTPAHIIVNERNPLSQQESGATSSAVDAGNEPVADRLLGAADIRAIAAAAGIRPTKKFGQNFVIDPGTVRRIVREAGIRPNDAVLEVGPGLGSLTLALLEAGAHVHAVEIDPALASRLPDTVERFMPEATHRLTVIRQDALTLSADDVPELAAAPRFTLVANLPYNVATPIVLTLLERFAPLDRILVMVQKEVADRLAARPGSKIYGAPSVKLAWYGSAQRVGTIGRHVFWPAPNVDSALVLFNRHHESAADPTITVDTTAPAPERERVFALIDAAFGQRRKTLHAALRHLVSDSAFTAASIEPTRRGETLTIEEFSRLAAAQALA